MFAPPVAAARSKSAVDPLRTRARQGSTIAARRLGERRATPGDTAPHAASRRLEWNFGSVAVAPADRETWPDPARPLGGSALRFGVQAKLVVGQVNDPLEHEADHVADRVMRMPDPVSSLAAGPMQVSRECAACEEDETLMRRAEAGHGPAVAPDIVHGVIASPGQPIEQASRDFFEPRMGRDFSSVRIHLGAAAAASAHAVGARAYTVGSRIVFAADAYAPGSEAGKRLLAHELAHVVQQNPGLPDRRAASIAGPAPVRPPDVTAASPDVLARQPAHCGGAWTCARDAACEQADTPGNGTASTSWTLDLNIDTDVPESTDIASAADVGHTYVVFSELNGAQYSYGFYPRPETKPTDFASRVFGCVVHPDSAHKPCIDYTKSYTLSQPQHAKALQFAQSLCKAPPNYDLFNWNCTTASVAIAQQAGQTPPTAKGKVAGGTTSADNPNTLKAGYLDQDVPTRHLTSDTDIRNWASTHSATDVTPLPTAEKVRLLNRLLDGFVSDDDVTAFEKICTGITAATERTAVQAKLGPREDDLYSGAQKARVHAALFGSGSIPAPAPGVSPPPPPPP